jgi:thiamine-phosphate pyrophosphorylase
MIHRHKKLPTIWLMTDARLGQDLLPAICRLPQFSGVIFRHYELAVPAREALLRKIQRICNRRGHLLIDASPNIGNITTPKQNRKFGRLGLGNGGGRCGGVHNPGKLMPRNMAIKQSYSVHNIVELRRAKSSGADMVLISPVYKTRSHADARPLGPMAFLRLARLAAPIPVIALGGMNAQKTRRYGGRIIHGWAAIDAHKRS